MQGSALETSSKKSTGISVSIHFGQKQFIEASSELLKDHPDYQRGFCNGLTFLWAYFKSVGHEADFFKLYSSILAREPGSEFTPMMKRFIEVIKHYQKPEAYGSPFEQTDFANNINSIIPAYSPTVEPEYQICFNFTEYELEFILKRLPVDKKMLLFYSPNHVIGAMKIDGVYHIYDPNVGREIASDSEVALAKFICISMLQHAPRAGKCLPLSIKVYKHSTQSTPSYFTPAELIEHVLKYRGDIKRDDAWPGFTSLHYAAARGDLQSVNALLPSSNIHLEYNGTTPIEVASYFDHYTMLRPLSQAGGDINLALLEAAKMGNELSVTECIMLGAKPDYKDEEGLTALDYAVISNKRSMVKILLNVGAWSAHAIDLAISNAYGDITNDLAAALLNRCRTVTPFYLPGQQQATALQLAPGASP
ncbi:MAG: hypothetical protein K0S29_1448 [Gammaproteobacteria bacterium]|jgi:hypothetical protein|nr:hypothetical protein [Gammaproteobacteria bacterium]